MKFFIHFLFRFLLTRDFRWVTERIQSPIQNLESIENEKENEKKKFIRFVGNLSMIPKLSFFFLF